MSESEVPYNLYLFETVIAKWSRRSNPNEPLTLNQLAHLVLGKGNSQNASIVGRAVSEFGAYFHAPRGYGKKWTVNWEAVARDHPRLLGKSTSTPAPLDNQSPIEGISRALEDEISAVRREIQARPIFALGAASIGTAAPESFLYEALLDLGDREQDLPVPEGVRIRLVWSHYLEPSVVEGTLLSYDPLTYRTIFETTQPLPTGHLSRQFRILPSVDELLKAVQRRLLTGSSNPNRLFSKLLGGSIVLKEQTWPGKVAAERLDESQFSAIQHCLTRDFAFIWGPPGTGKTYSLGWLIASAALQGERVLGVAIANVAVDQLAIKVREALQSSGRRGLALLNEGKVVRFGHPRLPEVTGDSRFFPRREEIQLLRNKLHEVLESHRRIPQRDQIRRALSQKLINELRHQIRELTRRVIREAQVVLTTATQVCLEDQLLETSFEMAVVDEASMMSAPYLACVALAASKRITVAGDFRQLGPIALSRSEAAFKWLLKDVFDFTGVLSDPPHAALTMLNVQRRMHPDICNLINMPFYDGELVSAVEGTLAEVTALGPLPGEAVVLVALLPEDGSQVEFTAGRSRRNRVSAEIVARLASKYLTAIPKLDLGIVTPYRAQASLIRRLLIEQLPDEDFQRLKVGTVHAFQGAEADAILWDIVDTRVVKLGKLYRGDAGDRLANVAISRARAKLVMIGDPRTFINAPSSQVGEIKTIMLNYFGNLSPRVIHASELSS